MTTAEEIGLEALGLPPSLPDIKSLLNNGEDYLVKQAADASGVPESAIKTAYEKGKDLLVEQFVTATNAAQGLDCKGELDHSWRAFDSGARAPSVIVSVTRPATDTSGLPSPKDVCVTDTNSGLQQLYFRSCASLPANIAPGTSLTLRIPLTAITSERLYNTAVEQQYTANLQSCESYYYPGSQLVAPEGDCWKRATRELAGTWQARFANGTTSPTIVFVSRALSSSSTTQPSLSAYSESLTVSTIAGCGGDGQGSAAAAFPCAGVLTKP